MTYRVWSRQLEEKHSLEHIRIRSQGFQSFQNNMFFNNKLEHTWIASKCSQVSHVLQIQTNHCVYFITVCNAITVGPKPCTIYFLWYKLLYIGAFFFEVLIIFASCSLPQFQVIACRHLLSYTVGNNGHMSHRRRTHLRLPWYKCNLTETKRATKP